MRWNAVLLGLVLNALGLGCSFNRVPLEGLACPCQSGWVCDEPTRTCVQLETREAGADTSIDGGPDVPDAGTLDGGVDVRDGSMDVPRDSLNTDSPIDSGRLGVCETLLSSAMYCDDFEVGFERFWTIFGATEITSESARGSSAVEFDAGDGGVGALRVLSPSFDGADSIYFRAHVRVVSLAGTTNPAVALFQLRDVGGDGFEITIQRTGTRITAARASANERGEAPPVGEWFCLRIEAELRTSASAHVRVFLNDSLLVEAANAITGGVDNFVAIGPQFTNGDGAAVLQMDDVAMGTSSLPCD